MKKMIKVVIDYRDGHYSMMPVDQLDYTPDENQIVEIPVSEWDEYSSFLFASAHWYKYIRNLDNMIYERLVKSND